MRYHAFVVTLFLFFTLALIACGRTPDTASHANEGETEPSSAATPFLSFQDDTGHTVTLNDRPERIVVLSPEFLKLLYDLGGEVVGRMSTYSAPIPEEAEHITELGTVNQINVEQLTALNPDLVIGSPSFHAKLSDLMESQDIPLALLQMRSFDDVKEKATLLGKMTGSEQEAAKALKETERRMEHIVAKVPEDGPSFVVLNVSSSSISIQRANTTALEIGELLHMDNVAKHMDPKPDSQTSAPYSIETLVKAQPDYVFITIHGARETGMEKVKEELEGNPAWASLKAVQEDRVMAIPTEKYLTNPGLAYDQSMEHMAKIVYPDIWDDEKR